MLYIAFTIADTLRNAHGNYTPNTINRAGKVVGAVGKALDAAFHQNVCETDVDESYGKRYDYSADVATFCVEYKDEKLFEKVPARAHSAFKTFERDTSIQQPHKLKQRLLKCSKRLDQLHEMHGRFQ